MEHEVHVPFPVGSVRAALAEAERGMRCVPGLTLDAVDGSSLSGTAVGGADGAVDEVAVHGRLRVRIGGSSITYRGTLRLSAREQGFAVEADGVEARGGAGAVQLRLTVQPREAAAGDTDGADTALAFSGSVRGEGRLAEFEDKQLNAAGRQLLDRFAAALADSLAADPPGDDNAPVIPGIPAPEAEPPGAVGADEDGSAEPQAVQDEESGLSVFETEIPPPSLDRGADADDVDAGDVGAGDPGAVSGVPANAEIPAPGAPPAEAAHARRTMIGRSAEEVDHAPPRGRYAPVPPPEPTASGATLRWAAPAAALAVAGVVVLSRAVRRRHR